MKDKIYLVNLLMIYIKKDYKQKEMILKHFIKI